MLTHSLFMPVVCTDMGFSIVEYCQGCQATVHSCMEHLHPVCVPCGVSPQLLPQLGLLFHPDEGGKVQNHEEVLEGHLLGSLKNSSPTCLTFPPSFRPLWQHQVARLALSLSGKEVAFLQSSALVSRWPLWPFLGRSAVGPS